MTIALDVIKSAMRKIRVLGVGQTPSSEDADDILYSLNAMLDTWSAEGLPVYALTTDIKALTAGDYDITIGTGGDINTTRPDSIDADSSFIRDSNSNDYPLKSMTKEEYNRITLKNPGNSIPSRIFYDTQYPLGVIYLYMPPTSGLSLYLVSAKPFTAFTDTADAFSFPPGYQEAIEYNLAVKIAPDFGKVASQDLLFEASRLLSTIKTRSMRNRPMVANMDDVPAGHESDDFDILTGE